MIVIIDSHAICHQVFHSMGDMTSNNMPTGVIFGFMLKLLEVRRATGVNDFVFTWDSKKSERKKIFPEYKDKSRAKTEDGEAHAKKIFAYEQFEILRDEIIPDIGFKHIYQQEGYEADDLIASIVLNNKKQSFIIASGDGDLYQLLEKDRVSMYHLLKKQIFTESDFIAQYDITPNNWAEVKAITGCTSDNVPGVFDVGETTAIKYVTGRLKTSSKRYSAIMQNQDIIERNLPLVTLPFPGTKKIVLKPPYVEYNIDELIDVFQYYGFNNFLGRFWSQWQDWFKNGKK